MTAGMFMSQPLAQGFRTWVCVCGRLGLALGLEECPECGQPRETAAVPEPSVTAAPRPRKPPVRRQPPARKTRRQP